LHTKLNSVEHQLSKDTIAKLRYIASIRNKAMHQDYFEVEDIDNFMRTCKLISSTLKKLPKNRQPDKPNPKKRESKTTLPKNGQPDKPNPKKRESKTVPKAHKNESSEHNSFYFYSVILIAFLLAGVWFILGGSSTEEKIQTKQNKIHILKSSKKALDVRIRKVDIELTKKIRKQGPLRSLFNDTEAVDHLEELKDKLVEQREMRKKNIKTLAKEIVELKMKLRNN